MCNVLCVARNTPEKGIGELIAALNQIKKNNSKVSLKIISSLPYSKIQKIYQDADIFCLPSKNTKYWQEQFGMALVEAMSCGLPIVTTNSGAISEVCGEDVLYAKQADAHDLQLKLESLINNPPLRKALGQKARERAVKLYDKKIIARKILKLYQNLCP